MYRVDGYNIKLIFSLENGVYIFDNESATGKTRLCGLMKKYQSYGEPVASYTYSDLNLGIPIESILVPDKYRVIMLDRYDMYEGAGAEKILECAETSIVLIDCKHGFSVTDEDDWCTLEMKPDTIEVLQ